MARLRAANCSPRDADTVDAPPLCCWARRPNTIPTATTVAPETFDHIRLDEIDDSRKPLDANVYTLEISKLDPVYKEVKNPTSEYFGQQILVMKGSFTVVDDPKYSGRKLWQDFWTAFKVPLIFLKKISAGTGMAQAEGQTLSDWASQFATLNPPARFQVQVDLVPDKRDPDGPPVNEIKFFTVRPV